LADGNNPASIQAIGDVPHQKSQGDHRKELKKADQSKRISASGLCVNKPTHGNGCNLETERRKNAGNPKEYKTRMPEQSFGLYRVWIQANFSISAIGTYDNRSAQLQQVLNCGREEYNRMDTRPVTSQTREQFVTHLRPAEVALSIGHDQEETENALRQLRLWGNLEVTQDTAEQVSLEQFYRVHLLYALSLSGEAAERALALFEETLQQPGELQTAALRDITEFLEAIRILIESAELDVAKLHTQLLTLTERTVSRRSCPGDE
jgi:hypothetical protein